jgi:hypothetical protein
MTSFFEEIAELSKKPTKEKIMDSIEIADYFGHVTETEFLNWAVGQFKEHADVIVTDKSEMTYKFELGEQDGCCEICYTEDASVDVKYEDTILGFVGYYSYEGGSSNDLVLTISDTVEVNKL